MKNIEEIKDEWSFEFYKLMFKMQSVFEILIKSKIAESPDPLELYYFIHFVLLSELADSEQDEVFKKYSNISLEKIAEKVEIKDIAKVAITRLERFNEYSIYKNQINDGQGSKNEKFAMYIHAACKRIYTNSPMASTWFGMHYRSFIGSLARERIKLSSQMSSNLIKELDGVL